MIVGQLYKFVNHNALFRIGRIEGKHAIYLGEDFIYRDDGQVVENHKVLVVGESRPTIIDRSLLKCMRKLEA